MSADDPIENIVGRFGRYQIWIWFLIIVGRLPTDYQLTNVVFIIPSVDYVCLDERAHNLTNYCPCDNPKYDQTSVINSVTTTWNLICDKSQFSTLAQSILQVGILGGSLFYGYISDRYGRRFAILLALFSEVLFVALSAAVPKFWMFIVLRFFIGTAVGGTMLCSFVMLVELSGKSFRPYLAALVEVAYITGYFTLPIIAYFLRDWRQLQMATSLPWLFVIFYYYLLPESPRWLLTRGETEKAIDVLTHIAQKNGRPTHNIRDIVEKIQEETAHHREQRGSYSDLFKTPKIRLYTLVLAYVWLCCSHTFFGINQYIGQLQGNLYMNVMFSALSLAPGLVLVAVACRYLKRRLSIVTSFVIAGVSLLIFIFVPNSMKSVQLTFAIIGQLGAYTAFAQIYLYSSETFPTVIRNSAMGFTSMFARIGGFIAPFVVNIGVAWISLVIFSAMAFLAASLFYFLPETKDRVLLNTIGETEKSKSKKIYS